MAHTARPSASRNWEMYSGLVGLGLGLAWSLRAWPFLVDDAFIVARYARRLSHGAGYTFQAGAASDGVTGPLWLLPLTLGAWLGLDAVWVAKALGLACSLGATLLVLHAAARRQGGRLRGVWLALLLGTAAPLWIWAVGGLETGLATLLCTWLARSALARPGPRGGQVGLAALGLAWLRPELALWVALMLSLVLVRKSRAGLTAIGLAALGGLSVLGFRWLAFGHLLPLSVHAKPPVLSNGLGYLIESVQARAVWVLLPWLVCGAWRGTVRARVLSASLLLHAAAIVLAGGDWMPGARLFVPLIPVACWLVADQLVVFGRRRARWIVALGALGLVVRGESAWRETGAARDAGALREARLPLLLQALGPYPDPVVALDIGALGYVGERRLIDLGGLVEPAIAYAPGGHLAKRFDARWLEARAPGAIVLHSRLAPRVDASGRLRWFAGFAVERSVLAQAWVLERFRVVQVVPYAADYFYVVLAPR